MELPVERIPPAVRVAPVVAFVPGPERDVPCPGAAVGAVPPDGPPTDAPLAAPTEPEVPGPAALPEACDAEYDPPDAVPLTEVPVAFEAPPDGFVWVFGPLTLAVPRMPPATRVPEPALPGPVSAPCDDALGPVPGPSSPRAA